MVNSFVAVMSVVSWLMLARGSGDADSLALRGRRSLQYFTVLSNLASGLVSAAYAASYLWPSFVLPGFMVTLRLVTTTAVMLTFTTVIVLLAPRFGWGRLYRGGNLWMHLILPLFAAVDACLFVPIGKLPFWATLWSLVPFAAYGAWYVLRVLRHGAEADGIVYDFYGFLRWGADKLAFVALGMGTATWLLAVALWLVGGLLYIGV
jgi:hypothetical protein